MQTTVQYETKKGNLKQATFMFPDNVSDAYVRDQSRKLVETNGQRQCKRIRQIHITREQQRRGILARFLGRG